jgi:hypothetical protein
MPLRHCLEKELVVGTVVPIALRCSESTILPRSLATVANLMHQLSSSTVTGYNTPTHFGPLNAHIAVNPSVIIIDVSPLSQKQSGNTSGEDQGPSHRVYRLMREKPIHQDEQSKILIIARALLPSSTLNAPNRTSEKRVRRVGLVIAADSDDIRL